MGLHTRGTARCVRQPLTPFLGTISSVVGHLDDSKSFVGAQTLQPRSGWKLWVEGEPRSHGAVSSSRFELAWMKTSVGQISKLAIACVKV